MRVLLSPLAAAALSVAMTPVVAGPPGDDAGDVDVPDEDVDDVVQHEYLLGPDGDETALPDDAELIEDLGGGWKLVVLEEGTDPTAIADDLATATGGTAVPNAILEPAGPTDEPRFGEQWSLRNTGQTGGVNGADINAPKAWGITTGKASVVVAVLDSGIALDHPDLASRLWRNPGENPRSGKDDDGNGYVDDVHGWNFVDDNPVLTDTTGHGTAMAGIIAAAANGVGISGVAPGVRLMPLRVCTNQCLLSDIVAALAYAADNGADVVNMSFTGKEGNFRPIADLLTGPGSGMVAVAAAGNEGVNIDTSPRYPASFDLPNLIAVAATDHNDRLVSWSNYGSRSVHLGAPGVAVLSTSSNGGYATVNGTSPAAPHVAGVAALVLSARPDLSSAQVAAMVKAGTESRGSLHATTKWRGRLNAARSVSSAVEHTAGDSGYPFVDIAGSVFAADIVWLAQTGITKGCNPPANDRFCPDDPVTRGQFAAFLRRALDVPAGPDAFDDDAGSTFEADINALAAAGIAKGCNPPANTRFCPRDNLSRAEMASFLQRALDLPRGEARFVDIKGNVHAGPIGALSASGITKGCDPPTNSYFCPNDDVTRGQFAAFLHRADIP